MKYRAAATQIKEIPIIFRGNVETGETTTEYNKDNAILDQSIQFDPTGYGGNYNEYTIMSPGDEYDYSSFSKLYVLWGDELHEVSKRESENQYGKMYMWGAAYDIDTDQADFSTYPFVIVLGYDYDLQQYSIFQILTEQTINDEDVTIWSEEPEIIVITNPFVKLFSADITGNGQIKRFHCRFALGENGTLRIKPYVILNGNIRIDLCAFASNGDNYISGDNEEIAFDCYVPVETHAVAYVEAENVGEYESILDAAMVVQYEDYIESESIVGYEGINLNRR